MMSFRGSGFPGVSFFYLEGLGVKVLQVSFFGGGLGAWGSCCCQKKHSPKAL